MGLETKDLNTFSVPSRFTTIVVTGESPSDCA